MSKSYVPLQRSAKSNVKYEVSLLNIKQNKSEKGSTKSHIKISTEKY